MGWAHLVTTHPVITLLKRDLKGWIAIKLSVLSLLSAGLLLTLCESLVFFFFFWQCNEITKINSNLVVIGKPAADNDKEDLDNDADDDDPDNAEDSEGDEFEQETG